MIVTNAHKTWVDYGSQTLMPLTAVLLKSRIRVLSARMYQPNGAVHAAPSHLWKVKKFLELHDMFGIRTDLVTNLIVVGDSMHEMNAG